MNKSQWIKAFNLLSLEQRKAIVEYCIYADYDVAAYVLKLQ